MIWDDLPSYWGTIGQELTEYHIALMQEEARQAREWLQLQVQPLEQNLTLSQQTLQIQVDNTSGIAWRHQEAQQRFLEGGEGTIMRLELEVNTEGRYRVTGEVHAEDLSGSAFSMPFAFQLSLPRCWKNHPAISWNLILRCCTTPTG